MQTVPQHAGEQHLLYKQIGDQINDLYFFPPLKEAGAPAPVLLLIPGGGWHRNDAISMYNMAKPTADVVRQNGFAVASITYRGSVPDGASMEQIVSDVLDAMGYLARYASVLNIDPARFYTMGHSAGGHLAAQVAYMSPAERAAVCAQAVNVKACVALSAPMSLLPEDRERYYTFQLPASDIAALFPHPERAAFERYSPLCLQNKPTVPTLLAAGDADQLVDHRVSLALLKGLQDAGQDVEWILCRGGGHCFEPVNGSDPKPDGISIMQMAADYLLRHSE